MTPAELKQIKKEINAVKSALAQQLEDLDAEITSMRIQLTYGQGSGDIAFGDRVRVYAACSDMEGSSLEGQEATVVKVPGPDNPYAKTITVRLLHKDFDGQEVRVYPQQCERS